MTEKPMAWNPFDQDRTDSTRSFSFDTNNSAAAAGRAQERDDEMSAIAPR